MSITEAIEKVKVLMDRHTQDMEGLIHVTTRDWEEAVEDCAKALPVIESYVQEKEGQGGLGL